MEKLKSRKLWMAIIAGALVVLNEGLGFNFDKATVISFSGIVLTYILGQSVVDASVKKG